MSVKNKTNKNYKRSQKGRSMVEMLGVLAIVGTLSVGGVYGYGVAMKKHKANELLHRASMLASTVSAQIMTGKNLTTLDSFANSDFGTFTLETYTDGDNTFKLKISDIDGNVCEQMKSSMGGMVRDIVCDENAKTALMTFNKDLSTTDLPKTESVIDKNITNPEDCQKAGKTWCVEAFSEEGQCSNSTDCCRGVSAPTCKDCTVVEGGYTFTNVLPSAECDSDGDGINDGQCLPDESGNPPFTCQQVSCQETESCCVMYDMDMLADLNDPTTMEALGISLSTWAKQVHQAQCSSCDTSDGKTTPLADGTNCFYFSDTSSVEMMAQFMSAGQCQSGSCTTDRPCDLQHLENCCLLYSGDFEINEEMVEMFGWEKVADLFNHYQCGTCDTSSLQIQSKPDGTSCGYVFINADNEPQALASVCANGICSPTQCDDGFVGYFDKKCYPCDSDESPNMNAEGHDICIGKCPNRKVYYPLMTELHPDFTIEGYVEKYLCVKSCPDDSFITTEGVCYACGSSNPLSSTVELCEGRCPNRELINGKCVLKQV